jgi:3-hydroxyisobutyrate dehydrogenase-like beta-hydroxyacid dehydrogenase
VIGVLHPGEMGSAVAAQLVRRGHRVLWVSAGRSSASAERAASAGLEEAGSLAALASAAPVVLSICPPHAALEVAGAVADAGFQGLYVDANAIAPATARAVAERVERGGARFVDGSIVGPPPGDGADSRLYLSGSGAEAVAGLFAGSELETVVMDGPPGAASALKMAYAGWTKGTIALLLAMRALARAEGVEEALLAEWALSQPQLPDRQERAARSAARKGWRWVAEMEEIAATLEGAGLPPGFHEAAAEVFRRTSHAAGGAGMERLEPVLAALLPPPRRPLDRLSAPGPTRPSRAPSAPGETSPGRGSR